MSFYVEIPHILIESLSLTVYACSRQKASISQKYTLTVTSVKVRLFPFRRTAGGRRPAAGLSIFKGSFNEVLE